MALPKDAPGQVVAATVDGKVYWPAMVIEHTEVEGTLFLHIHTRNFSKRDEFKFSLNPGEMTWRYRTA